MTPHAVLDRRRREREQRIDVARKYGEALSRRVPVRRVIVFGSVARGDFNAWSDIDVLVLAEELPAGGRDRLALLHDPAFLGVQPVGWTPDEFDAESSPATRWRSRPTTSGWSCSGPGRPDPIAFIRPALDGHPQHAGWKAGAGSIALPGRA